MTLRTSPWLRTATLMAAAVHTAPALSGGGWYLGLEAGANFLEDQSFRIYNALPGLIPGLLPADGDVVAEDSFDTGLVGGIALGYGFANGLRPELAYNYRKNDVDTVEAAGTGRTSDSDLDETLSSLMANLWFDFGGASNWRPYLGGGVGMSRWSLNDPSYANQQRTDDDDDVFTYQLGAGLAYNLSPHWTLALDYRYLKTDDGEFDIFENSPNTRIESEYEAHAALIGLRYYFSAPAPLPEPVAEVPVVVPVETPPPACSDGSDNDGDGLVDFPADPGCESADDLDETDPAPKCQPPAAGTAISLEGCAIGDTVVLRGVNFEFDQARLTRNAQAILDGVAESLLARSDIAVEVGGHTDDRGSDEYNQKLSERRARSVRSYLLGLGIEGPRMTAKGYGESQPVVGNDTDEGRELNRRVELKVTASSPEMSAPVIAAPAAEPIADEALAE